MKKELLKKLIPIVNRVPFVNSVKLGKGNRLSSGNKRLFRCRIECHGTGNSIELRDGGVLRRYRIHIHGNNNHIVIGIKASANDSVFHIEDDDNSILIGGGSALVGSCHLACIEGTQIVIGSECLFSGNITLRTGDSHSIVAMDGQRINPSRSIIIGDHVWIGNGVTITKGVSIGANSVIATGAIVTKPVEKENVIIAGIPAAVTKENINWKKERI